MNATRNTLPLDSRESSTALLNQALADAIHLSLHAKGAHWGVRGTSFIALHKLFDEVHEAADEMVDQIAERITALGGAAESALSTIKERSRLEDYPLKTADGLEHVKALSDSLAAFSDTLRSGIAEADDLSDPATADLLTQGLREIDKYLWFVEAHLPAGEPSRRKLAEARS